MAYHDPVYLFLFLPLTLAAYQCTSRNRRWLVLLGAGYLFFWSVSGKLVLYLIGTTLWCHYISLWMGIVKAEKRNRTEKRDREFYKRKERLILAGGIGVLLGVLAYLKYYNFFVCNAGSFLDILGMGEFFRIKSLIMPIGISFYTLQAIGYLADVYWEKIPSRQNLGKLALFLGFFPQIMEGPIGMYSQTAEALWKGESLKAENLTAGSVRILWGLFKKMVIADRLYLLVTGVFDHYESYHGSIVAVAAIAYTVQLYMEFSGCMDIVIGSGQLFGVHLPENFRQPFASVSAAEFWRRWHITLGTWLKTYVFYPVSASRPVKHWNRFGRKHLGKYWTRLGGVAICLFPVWLCNGIWHGAGWHYIFYGMYYFVILLVGAAAEPARNRIIRKFGIREQAWYWRTPRILKTWMIIFVGELFFRANGLKAGWHMFQSMFRDFQPAVIWDGSLLGFGLDAGDYLAIAAGCGIAWIVGMIKERNLLGDEGISKFSLPLRWIIYYGLILAVLVFGAYGVGYRQVDLIYAGF